MHAAAIVEKIHWQATSKGESEGDLLGQMQLAEAVNRRFINEARGCRQ